MKVGIVIPVWNRAALLKTALRSVLRESGAADLDVVVVDDGSTDGSGDVARGIAEGTPSMRVLTQRNAGVNAARTAGIAALHPETEIVTFLDSDDLWPEGRLARDLAIFETRPETELVYGRMQIVDAVDETRMAPAAGCREFCPRGAHLGAGLYRRDSLARVGGFDFDLPMAEDVDFLLRLFEQHPHVAISDNIAMIYRLHDGNMTADVRTSRRWFMLALHKAAMRRKENPDLGLPEGVFDLGVMRADLWNKRGGA